MPLNQNGVQHLSSKWNWFLGATKLRNEKKLNSDISVHKEIRKKKHWCFQKCCFHISSFPYEIKSWLFRRDRLKTMHAWHKGSVHKTDPSFWHHHDIIMASSPKGRAVSTHHDKDCTGDDEENAVPQTLTPRTKQVFRLKWTESIVFHKWTPET